MKGREILNDLVSFNTIRDKENKEIMDYIENYLKGYNFETKRVEKCLIAYNDSNPNVGFVGHTDTVDYGSWDGDPFTLTEDNGKLIGLGACDMKGGLASILAVISKIDLNKNKIALYFTNDEETNFGGIYTIRDLIVPNNIIIGEPTDNIPIYGTKGVLDLKITFYGVKCHSSTPDKGVNAIFNCVEFINKIRNYYETELKNELCNDFSIPYTTMNVGLINGGETVNSVPGKCEMSLDFRLAIKGQGKIILDKIKEFLKDIQYDIVVYDDIDPKLNLSDISFLEEVSSKKETKNYLTEGSVIDKNFVILGPGPDTSHQKNEYILETSLNKTIELYETIVKYYNQN